jgi:hypothetical protein
MAIEQLSGIEKVSDTPPIAVARNERRRTPDSTTPISVDVPPTSMTIALLAMASFEPPMNELVGPAETVFRGYLPASSTENKVPLFWVIHTSTFSPQERTKEANPLKLCPSNGINAEFRIVAFSLSIIPMPPII